MLSDPKKRFCVTVLVPFDGSPEAPSEARWRTDVSAFRTLDSMSQQKVETLFFNVSNQFSFKLILISSKRKNKINKF